MVRLHDHEVTLERLSASHAKALLAFERENREYFAASVPDRGDAYFDEFDLRHESLRAEQEAGICQFHVLVDAAGAVVGRVNLVDLENGAAELGYRAVLTRAGFRPVGDVMLSGRPGTSYELKLEDA